MPLIAEAVSVEVEIVVGTLNKEFGYNGFLPIKAGTPVYEYKGSYFFNMETIKEPKQIIQQKFYKEDLKSSINFSNEYEG